MQGMARSTSPIRDSGEIAWGAFEAIRDSVAERLPFVAVGVIAAALCIFAGKLAKHAVRIGSKRARIDPMLSDLMGSIASGLMMVIGVLIAFVIIFPTFRPGDMIAGLGITSIALGFAFKDILQNWLAGIFLLWRRPFRIGDQIRSGEYEGTVEEIRVRSTVVLTYDGERVIVPNSDVYTRAIVVRTAFAYRRTRIDVGIAYEEDVERAREIVHRVLASTEGIRSDPPPWVYLHEFAPSAVTLRVYLWTAPDQASVLRSSDAVASAIKEAFDEAGVVIPYPHQVQIVRQAAPYEMATGRPPSGE